MAKIKKKVALIFGITGQDGSYLTELLLKKNYVIHGVKRRSSSANTERIDHIFDSIDFSNKNFFIHYGDISDGTSTLNIINKIKPDEIYNLAAQSHVKVSFEIPQFTVKTNAIGVLNILEAFRKFAPKGRFYQASSSEMFGVSVDKDKFQRETTELAPNSPYGCSKVFSFYLTKFYRRAYKLFVANGILFNHESPFRGTNFVTNKIVKGAVSIKLGLQKKLVLGNLDAYRDWGHSKDYVDAMHKILNHKTPDDFVVASGKTYSVRDFCNITFNKLGLNYKNFVVQNKKYFRPGEVPFLKGDARRARKILKWKPKYTVYTLIDDMIESWNKTLQK